MDEPQLQDNPLAERLAAVLEGAYVLEGEIGRGGMGVVFVARDLKLKRRVAIKVLPPELAYREEIRTRFIREAQTAARLSHPHIVPIHAVGDEGGLVYFVMGFVDGESLGQRLRRRGRLPTEEVRRIMKETADALGMAHAMGVVHRDIKPDNVLLEGTRRRVMVTDFGIAKALSEISPGALTGTGVAIGTPHYMSPEQAAGERDIDARSDLYALGVVAYEALTGELPFNAPTVPGILMKQITEMAPDVRDLRPDVSDDLASSIQRCLEKDPSARWPTAESLRRALETRTVTPYRRSAPVAQPRRESRGRALEPMAPRPRSPGRRDRDDVATGGVARTPTNGEPAMITKFRGEAASYVSTVSFLMLLNIVAPGLEFPWFLFPTAFWGFGIGKKYTALWTSGYSWRDVLNRPPAPDAVEARNPGRSALRTPRTPPGAAAPAPMATIDGAEFGRFAEQLRQVDRDRQGIHQIVARLPDSERGMLPEIGGTVDGLTAKAQDLARTLVQMDEVRADDVERLDGRIDELRRDADANGEGDRRIDLLERQRTSLRELAERRRQIESQFEACVLAVQNVRFDLLRLRSAGIAAVLEDLTSATQQARALSFDIEAAIEAAGELRRP
ncbi:MAG: protein kinase [Gemmatimonadales bacterium]